MEGIELQADFGKRLAKVFDSFRDSHVFFYLQQAYPEDADNWEWTDFQNLLNRVLGKEVDR